MLGMMLAVNTAFGFTLEVTNGTITHQNGNALPPGTTVFTADPGDLMTIEADPPPNVHSSFYAWTGDVVSLLWVVDAGAATTLVWMLDDVAVTATYDLYWELTVNGGSVLNPGPDHPVYPDGAVVDIEADVPGGQVFAGWTGDVTHVDDADASTTFVTMLADTVLTGTTSPAPPAQRPPIESVDPSFGIGCTNSAGHYEVTPMSLGGRVLGRLVITDAHPGVCFDWAVTENDAPGPGTGTFAGFQDGRGLGRTFRVTPLAEDPGPFLATVSLVYQPYELAFEALSESEVEMHRLDETLAPPPGVWEPAGVNVGLATPTGIVGDSGYHFRTDGALAYWTVRDTLSHFAVGLAQVDEEPEDPDREPSGTPDDEPAQPVPPDDEAEDDPSRPANCCPCGMAGAPMWMMMLSGLMVLRQRTRRWSGFVAR